VSSPDEPLSAARITSAVNDAGLAPLSEETAQKFADYYSLLSRWNSRLNLTAIRNPEEALRRHFIECIFFAQHLPNGISTLLDFGSGAGFPGIPVALCRPEIQVTLAESQGKKSSFLREAVRSLGLNADVYAGRVEEMTATLRFDVVSLRAVDKMQESMDSAASRVADGGWLATLAIPGSVLIPRGFESTAIAVPNSKSGVMILANRPSVPRGT
jgi:16S rRNA (guanine527-N7)-methyltransferase